MSIFPSSEIQVESMLNLLMYKNYLFISKNIGSWNSRKDFKSDEITGLHSWKTIV